MADSDRKKRRRTKAEREEHAMYAQRSDYRKRAVGLIRLSVWVPAIEKEVFKAAADASTERFLGNPSTGQTCDICKRSHETRTGVTKRNKDRKHSDARQSLMDFD